MIEIRVIDSAHKADVRLPNQPFPLFGRMIPSYIHQEWSYTVEKLPHVTEMRFPDEPYDYDAMSEDTVFIGAYDGEACVGLAVMQSGFFKYMYLYDLKVNREYRGKGVARQLMEKARQVALDAGYQGVYTQGQDNNLAACRFYLKMGFVIGGLDTQVYKGTPQEGKADIIFYWDCVPDASADARGYDGT